MPQDYSKFSVSMREYVGLGRIEKMNDGETIQSAYKKANMENFINKYDKKDNTVIGISTSCFSPNAGK